QPVGGASQQRAVTALGVERAEAGIDHPCAGGTGDRPHEVVHRHRDIVVRVASEEVLATHRLPFRVLDGEHFVRSDAVRHGFWLVHRPTLRRWTKPSATRDSKPDGVCWATSTSTAPSTPP